MLVLVSLLFCIYTLTNSGRLHIVDEASLFAVTESLGTRLEVDTNAIAWTQYVNSPGEVLGAFGDNGEVYSKKGPAPAFLAVAFYFVLRLLTFLNIQIGLLQGTLLWNGMITAWTAALLWLTARAFGYRERTGMWLALLFGLATIAWPYATMFFGEPMSAFALLLTFYGLYRWKRGGGWGFLLAGGIGAGLTIATVTAHSVLVALLALYAAAILVERLRSRALAPAQAVAGVAAFVAPIAVAGALLMLYNTMRFGSPFDTGYHFAEGEGFSTPIWQGLWGLLFSPYRSLFLHTPLFVASIVGFLPFFRRNRAEAILIAELSAALIGMYSMWWMWWGGYSWGPRFLVPLSPFWVLLLAPIIESLSFDRRRAGANKLRMARIWGFAALATLSFLVQLGAVTINFVNYETMLRDEFFTTDWNNPLAYGPPAQSILDLLYSPVFGQLRLLLRGGITANSDVAFLLPSGEVNWTILFVGMAAIVTLVWLLWRWLHTVEQRDPAAPPAWVSDPAIGPSAPMAALVVAIPLMMTGAWLGGMAKDPVYGTEGTGLRAVLTALCADQSPDDALISVAPYDYHIFMNWLPAACKGGAMPVFGYALNALDHPETESVLTRLLDASDRINVVTAGVSPNDPENTVERWLADNAYKADDQWYDEDRLLHYATESALGNAPLANHNLLLRDGAGNTVTLVASRVPPTASAGDAVPVEIRYMLNTRAVSQLRWFVQLLSPEGVAVAQLDTGPVDNYVSFPDLPSNDILTERAGLLLPGDLAPGSYQIIAGLYNPEIEGAPRLTAADGREYLALATLVVE